MSGVLLSLVTSCLVFNTEGPAVCAGEGAVNPKWFHAKKMQTLLLAAFCVTGTVRLQSGTACFLHISTPYSL